MRLKEAGREQLRGWTGHLSYEISAGFAGRGIRRRIEELDFIRRHDDSLQASFKTAVFRFLAYLIGAKWFKVVDSIL